MERDPPVDFLTAARAEIGAAPPVLPDCDAVRLIAFREVVDRVGLLEGVVGCTGVWTVGGRRTVLVEDALFLSVVDMTRSMHCRTLEESYVRDILNE